MTVSRDEVLWAYRLLLGREAENEQVVSHHMRSADVATLRYTMLNSPEYAAKNTLKAPVVGRLREMREMPIEVVATPDQISRMLARIECEWSRMGETEPHWSVLTSDAFRPATIGDHLDDFYDTGVRNLEFILNPLRRAGIAADQFGRVLDYGCGVGRLTLPLATIADEAVGIDVSSGHIAHAEARAFEMGIRNAIFRRVTSISAIDDLPFSDLIVSLIVLQHNPPPLILVILQKLLGRLTQGGCAVFQLLTAIEGYSFATERYLAEPPVQMEMNVLSQHVVFALIERANCRVLEVREDDWMGNADGVSQTFAVIRPD